MTNKFNLSLSCLTIRIIGLLCFSCLSFASAAQPANLFLDQPNTTGDQVATQSITLKPGFTSTAPFHAYLIPAGAAVCTALSTSPDNTHNYVVTYTARNGGLANPAAPTNSTCDVAATIQYLDDLGRPLQTVQVKASPRGNDIIQPVIYDINGKETTKYLPYTTGVGAAGSYRADALNGSSGYNNSAQYTFYQQPDQGYINTTTPFSISVFELSTAERLLKQGAPGNDWQPAASLTVDDHTVKIDYGSNTGPDGRYAVRCFQADINADLSRTLRLGGTNGYYQPGELQATITKDENWQLSDDQIGTVEEYKDKDGHVVLKRTFNQIILTGAPQVLSTYYVYDALGNLAFVLPPAADGDHVLPAQSTLNSLCYQYVYDGFNRLIDKKLPNKDWDFLVYNALDQVIYTQDGEQRQKGIYSFIKYDVQGRIILTGIEANHTESIADLRSNVQNQSGSLWDTPSSATGNYNGYLLNSLPNNAGNMTLLTANYYDDYSFQGNAFGLPNTGAGQTTYTQGLLTASKVAVLKPDGSVDPALLMVNYYDEHGRVIESKSQNYVGGQDIIDNFYSFTDELTGTLHKHYKSNLTTPDLTIKNRYEYDQIGRKRNTYQQMNSEQEVLLSRVEYNELGQLQNKRLHSPDQGASYLQSIAYNYNERGWLLDMNTSSNLFSFNLTYNLSMSSVQPQWNGNISQMNYLTSKVAHPGARSFSYTYDRINRLTMATFSGGTSVDALDETISYDLMGNITQLNRGGAVAGQLTYNYNGNQLTSVTGYSPRSYEYDLNGNAKGDGQGKDITYNLLNLPQAVKIHSDGSTKANYYYSAAGEKLRNTGSDGTWDYVGGVVYKNGSIDFVQTEEGRVHNVSGIWNYEYNLTDHLGNVRVSIDKFNGAVRVIQEDEYYSFGLRKPTGAYDYSNNNRYLYNGKEMQTDLKDQYDYGARFYDPVIARWTGLDPLAEKMRSHSPYNYGFDDPMRFTDPDGMNPEDDIFSKKGKFLRHINNATNNILVQDGKDLIPWSHYAVSADQFLNLSLFPDRNSSNREMGTNIASYYAQQMNTKVKVGSEISTTDLAHFDPSTKELVLSPQANGHLDPVLNDSYALKSTIFHENRHDEDDKKNIPVTYLSHAEVYFEQITKDVNFAKAPFGFQTWMVTNFVDYIYGASYDQKLSAGADALINKFNKIHTNGWTISHEYTSGTGWQIFHKGKLAGAVIGFKNDPY